MQIYNDRMERTRAGMKAAGITTLILTPGPSMQYLSGFNEEAHERFLSLIIPIDDPCFFVTPSLNASQVYENPAGITDVRVWEDAEGWQKLMSDIVVDHTLDIGIIGLDDGMPARFAIPIQELIPTTAVRLAGTIVDSLRSIKDTHEIAAMQHAADATDSIINPLFEACKAGISEIELAITVQRILAENGHSMSFDPIIAAGANGAEPHHHTGRTKIKLGDIVVLDFGARVDGYCGDITRMAAVGEAPDEAKYIYDIVYQAHQAGVDAVKPGVTAEEVDAAVREVITDAGYGDFFMHRTGHGIGLDVHEAPNIVAGNNIPLVPGHCFSIEPGIYLPGKFGIRLENIVSVDTDGCALVLNRKIPATLPVI